MLVILMPVMHAMFCLSKSHFNAVLGVQDLCYCFEVCICMKSLTHFKSMQLVLLLTFPNLILIDLLAAKFTGHA